MTLTLTAREARVLAVLISANASQLRELEVTDADADDLRNRLDAEADAIAERDLTFLDRGYQYAAGVMEPGIPVATYRHTVAHAFAAGMKAAVK